MPSFSSCRQWCLNGLALCALLLVSSAPASDEHHGEDSDAHNVHSYHLNYIALFGGVTTEHRRERATTFGIEYERRLSERFGIGGLVEHAFGDLDFTVYALPFAYHSGRWKWYVAPGIEDPQHHSGTEFLVRVGLEYGFEVNHYEIAPQFDVDFVDGDQVVVFGLTVGRGF